MKAPHIDDLFQAVLALQDKEECYRFFEDLCTAQELQALAQRLAVAKRLAEGARYSQIAAETGASTATISRVKRSLSYGADGYRVALERMGLDVAKPQDITD